MSSEINEYEKKSVLTDGDKSKKVVDNLGLEFKSELFLIDTLDNIKSVDSSELDMLSDFNGIDRIFSDNEVIQVDSELEKVENDFGLEFNSQLESITLLNDLDTPNCGKNNIHEGTEEVEKNKGKFGPTEKKQVFKFCDRDIDGSLGGDLEVEFDFEPVPLTSIDKDRVIDPREREIREGLNEVDKAYLSNENRIAELDKEIEKFTNNADKYDYFVSVCSGLLAGLVDSFWVGEFNPFLEVDGKSTRRSTVWGNDTVNKFVCGFARLNGYKGNDLGGAIEHLEKKFKIPSDMVTKNFGGGKQHHLRDFAHHPTILGLLCSILTQFTGNAYGTDTDGSFIVVDIMNSIGSGKDINGIGKDIPQKLFLGIFHWFGHLVSDMAGTSSTAGAGTGIPGPIVSLAKELSALPILKKTESGENNFSIVISKLFNGTLLGEKNSEGKTINPYKFDLREELGILQELGRQSVPVILNECIVRGFYFIRRLITEIDKKKICHIKELNDPNKIDWKRVLPFNNRTIARMLSVATATFTAVDLVDAGIRAGMKSGCNAAVFGKEFVMRVNFVGVARLTIALGIDGTMGVKSQLAVKERIAINSQQLHLLNAKIYYAQAGSWIAAETTERSINEAISAMERAVLIHMNSFEEIQQSQLNISQYMDAAEKNNPGVLDEMNKILKWGKEYENTSRS